MLFLTLSFANRFSKRETERKKEQCSVHKVNSPFYENYAQNKGKLVQLR